MPGRVQFSKRVARWAAWLAVALAPAASRAMVEMLDAGHAIERPRAFDSADDEPSTRGLLEEHLAARMPRVDTASRRRIARTIRYEAARAALDPLLVLAVIDVESSFRVHVVSAAGAIGLMQLQLPTMREEAARSRLRSADPHDPVVNVQAGVRYLRRLLQTFGRLDVALMAYNAGPTRISGHLRRGGIPDRFQQYPRKVNLELARLRQTFAAAEVAASARASVARGPAGAARARYRLVAMHASFEPGRTALWFAAQASHSVAARPSVDPRSPPLQAVPGPGWAAPRGPRAGRRGAATRVPAGANAVPRRVRRSAAPLTAAPKEPRSRPPAAAAPS